MRAARATTIAFLFALLTNGIAAQPVPTSETGARIGERFEDSVVPRAAAPGALLRLESTAAPRGATEINITIRSIELVGTAVYETSDLPELNRLAGQRAPLQTIYDLAAELTARYSNDGYVLSRMIVPPQDFDPAAADIRLEAVEGYVSEVVWPQGLVDRAGYFASYAAKIMADRPLNIATLERYLLLAGDLPGLDFEGTLEPSAEASGAARLVVSVERTALLGTLSVDNRGTEGRGPYQFTAGVTANDVLGWHERISGTWAGSFEFEELQYGQLRIERVLNSEGLTAATAVSFDTGQPGTTQLQTLMFESRSLTVAGELSYPVIRSRTENLTVGGGFVLRDFESDILGTRFNQDRTRAFELFARYDRFDAWQGITQLTTRLSQGIDGLGSTENGNPLASRANGRVDFTVAEFSISRWQDLPRDFSFLGEVAGQVAGTPLLAAQECVYGGRTFGRALDPSSLAGDHCLKLLAEFRYDLDTSITSLSQSQLYAFADYGAIWRRAPAAGTPANADAASVGVGARASWQDRLFGALELAHGLHGNGNQDDWRVFLTLTAQHRRPAQ